MNDRCVYFHITPDTNQIFYIGIGKIARSKDFSTSHRNKHWNKIVTLHGKPKFTTEHKKKIALRQTGKRNIMFDKTIYNFYHEQYGRVSCVQSILRKTFQLNDGALSGVIKRRFPVHKGWRLAEPIMRELPVEAFGRVQGYE